MRLHNDFDTTDSNNEGQDRLTKDAYRERVIKVFHEIWPQAQSYLQHSTENDWKDKISRALGVDAPQRDYFS